MLNQLVHAQRVPVRLSASLEAICGPRGPLATALARFTTGNTKPAAFVLSRSDISELSVHRAIVVGQLHRPARIEYALL